ncbi:MAG: FAD-dependent oxidoreductase [Sutterella sp.]
MSRRTGRRLRTLTAAGFLLMTAAGLAWHTGWGTPSSFGWREIAEVCPLGALEAMIADRTFIPRAFVGLLVFFAITVLLGRIFCGWVCPVPLIRRFTGGEDRHAAAEAPSPLPQGDSSSPKDERTSCDEASCGDPSCASREAPASQCRICGAAKAKTAGSEALPEKGPLIVLGGALASTAVFGFPVFCLICPVGLTFALMIGLWRLFEFNEPSWSLAFFAFFLILELFVLRRWCHQFCPLGALITLMARLNRTFRATVNPKVCVQSRGIDCRVCRDACPEGIDPKGGSSPALLARCTKCRACADACPTKAISFPAFERFLKRQGACELPKPVPVAELPADVRRRDFAEAAPRLSLKDAVKESERCLRCGECVAACPLGNPIPEMMALMSEGRAGEAGRLLLARGALPDICSRICPQERLCEKACSMGRAEGAVAIGAIERAAADAAMGRRGFRIGRRRAARRASFAVIGAGPAGLACAAALHARGASVTVYEARSRSGGLLSHAVPAFKLDPALTARRETALLKSGIRFEFGRRVGTDVSPQELLEKFDALFIGTGAGRAVQAPIPGADAAGVTDALSFLEANGHGEGGAALKGLPVAVLGGGDTAVDCARTAVRMGASEVTVLYRGPQAKLRASARDRRLAEEEGVRIRFLADPVRFEAEEGVLAGVTVRNPETGAEETLPARLAVVAFGERCVRESWLEAAGACYDEAGRLIAGADGRTGAERIWAGGDAVRGPSLAVHAAADGRRAGEAMADAFGL